MRRSALSLISVAMLTSFTAHVVSAATQISVDRTLNWSDEVRIFSHTESQKFETLQFDGASYKYEETSLLPLYAESFPITSTGTVSVRLENPVFAPLENSNLTFPTLKSEIVIEHSIGYISKLPVLDISFVPLRKNRATGKVEKLVSFTIVAEVNPIAGNFRIEDEEIEYTDHSALAFGTWYKVSITKEGIYKIDKAFLESLGIDAGSVNTNTLGVFGNGGGMLPESNSEFRHDDIQENAVYRSGLDDGSFDDGDYILFYGQAPHRWQYNETSNTYAHQNHIYAEATYYFISTDRGTGKTIPDQPESLLAVTDETSEYDALAFHDIDKVNLLSSGRLWYGDAFDIYNTTVTYPFSIPGIDLSEPVSILSKTAGASASGSIYLKYEVNAFTQTLTIPPVISGFTETFAYESTLDAEFSPTSSSLNVDITYSGSSTGTAWLNYIELQARASISYADAPLFFRDARTMGAGKITKYTVNNGSGAWIWDITDQTNVKKQLVTNAGSNATFAIASDSLKEFVVFRVEDAFPSSDISVIGDVSNQDIHNIANAPDYVIVTHPAFISEARRLATYHHETNGLDTLVVTTTQVYNEFSSGAQDISAIRDMMRMFYKRAGDDAALMPRYLLLFGDCSFDYKSLMFDETENTLFVPNYESRQSLAKGTTYGTDDYFGFLDDSEGNDLESSTPKLDIGVGRIPVAELSEATEMVNKIMHYKSTETLGSWRNLLCFLADDEDYNTHIKDANLLAEYVDDTYPVYNIDKIYFDSYLQIPGAGGERYPDVETALNNRIFSGAFIMNYLGHGNEQNWAQERVLSVDDINSWDNFDKLPLFVTATCSFSKYDNPELRSAGELTLLNPAGGAIALVSTNRLVYASANYDLNSNFLEHIFEPVDGKMPTLGDALKNGKNAVTSEGTNNRKFILLGDPALVLNYPSFQVKTTEVNGIPSELSTDTLKALEKVTIKGEITDEGGIKMTTFNGTVYPAVYDKPVLVNTLVNDPTFSGVGFGPSLPYSFEVRKNALYKGKASVVNGEFEFTFIVPKDISYSFGNGKLSYYADNGLDDASGYDFNVIIGGTADSAAADDNGPVVDVFMNDETFVFGGLTDQDPFLLVKLNDFSGINTVGNGIGHDVTATLDEDQQSMITLNEYYEADLDQYQSGSVTYPLSGIAEGRHSVTVKAWDVYNNSGEGYTEFVVAESADLALSHVLNYPNPFTTNTSFWFEHNRPGDMLDVKVEIYSVSGKLIKTLQQMVTTDGYRVDNILWDGLDEFGDPIGRGVYVYKLTVKAQSDRSKAQEFQKLVILR